MGTSPTLSTALAHALYRTLLWQVVLLVVVTIAITLVLVRRDRTRPASATPEPTARRIVRIGLGSLWVLAGLLQAQPAMPASFVPMVVKPALADAPQWLVSLANPFTNLWLRHPVASDAVTVWLQVGIGIAIIVARTGLVARIALYVSIAWAAFVWVIGAAAGGLFAPHPSFLTGAPGAPLLYIVAAIFLLLPLEWWVSKRAQPALRIVVGSVFLLAAALQLLSISYFATGSSWATILNNAADGGIPSIGSRVIAHLATTVPTDPGLASMLFNSALLLVGIWLIIGRLTRAAVIVGAVVTFAVWWFAQGFGIFGGVATDANTGAILLVLLAACWPWPAKTAATDVAAASAETTAPDSELADATPNVWRWVPLAAALSLLIVLPVVAAFGMFASDPAQAAIGDSGGFVQTTNGTVPNFTLTDTNGKPVTLSSYRGKLVLISFLDPECYDSCPILANQMANAMDILGAKAKDVELIAIDVNPYFNKTSDTTAFTKDHGLTTLPNWHFVTGSNNEVSQVVAAFGQGITIPRVGMIGHPSTLVLVSRTGTELAQLNDTGTESLTQSYEQLLASTLRHYL